MTDRATSPGSSSPQGEDRSRLRRLEHNKHLIYVHVHKSVLDGWAVQVNVVGNGTKVAPVAHEVDSRSLRFATADEASAAGERLAREYIDRLSR